MVQIFPSQRLSIHFREYFEHKIINSDSVDVMKNCSHCKNGIFFIKVMVLSTKILK